MHSHRTLFCSYDLSSPSMDSAGVSTECPPPAATNLRNTLSDNNNYIGYIIVIVHYLSIPTKIIFLKSISMKSISKQKIPQIN